MSDMAAQRKKERRILLFAAIGLVLVLVAGGIGLQTWRTGRLPGVATSAVPTLTPVAIELGKPIRLGQAGAPVTITLFADFHCPHCAEFEEQFGPTVAAAQQSGRAQVEFYPMAFIDEGSVTAANAMACAAEVGFGQSYFNGLFANHTLQWSDEQLIDLAGKVGAQATPEFSTCVTTRKHAEWVTSITAAANAAGVQATPTIFINAEPVDLATVTVESLKAKIDEG